MVTFGIQGARIMYRGLGMRLVQEMCVEITADDSHSLIPMWPGNEANNGR